MKREWFTKRWYQLKWNKKHRVPRDFDATCASRVGWMQLIKQKEQAWFFEHISIRAIELYYRDTNHGYCYVEAVELYVSAIGDDLSSAMQKLVHEASLLLHYPVPDMRRPEVNDFIKTMGGVDRVMETLLRFQKSILTNKLPLPVECGIVIPELSPDSKDISLAGKDYMVISIVDSEIRIQLECENVIDSIGLSLAEAELPLNESGGDLVSEIPPGLDESDLTGGIVTVGYQSKPADMAEYKRFSPTVQGVKLLNTLWPILECESIPRNATQRSINQTETEVSNAASVPVDIDELQLRVTARMRDIIDVQSLPVQKKVLEAFAGDDFESTHKLDVLERDFKAVLIENEDKTLSVYVYYEEEKVLEFENPRVVSKKKNQKQPEIDANRTESCIRVFITDDFPSTLEGIVSVFSVAEDIEVCGKAANGEDAISMVREMQPDVVLMDIGLPGIDGIEATSTITTENPAIKVIMITSSDDENKLFEARRAGAMGYLVKSASTEEIRDAVRTVHDGDGYMVISQAFALKLELEAELLSPQDLVPESDDDNQVSLSERDLDLEVLKLLAQGITTREIAERLFISERTVRQHISNVLSRLHLNNSV